MRRDQGKMVFFDFRDRTGIVQGVVLPGSPAIDTAKEVRNEFVVRVEGTVNKRPEKNVQVDKLNGDIELEVKSIEVLSPAHELPFEKDTDLNLDTRFDYRHTPSAVSAIAIYSPFRQQYSMHTVNHSRSRECRSS